MLAVVRPRVRTAAAAALAAVFAVSGCGWMEVPSRPDGAETEPPATATTASPRFSPPTPRPGAPTTAPVEAEPAPATAVRPPGLHEVQAGETVYGIARLYGTDGYAIAVANGLSPPFDIREGQRLIIPGAPGRAAPRPTERPPLPAATPEDRPIAGVGPSPRPREEPAAEAESAPPADDGRRFLWPVEGRVISEYGPKGGGRFNDGINIAARKGAPVRAADAGVVAYAGNELRGFGKMLLVRHADGWVTAYAHNDELLVARGDRVRRGQVIARVGQTGAVSEPQLHFEIRRGKKAVDPLHLVSRPSASARRERSDG